MQQREFLARQFDFGAAAFDRALHSGLEAQVISTCSRLGGRSHPRTQDDADAGQELGKRKWLGEIVVGPGVEPVDAVGDPRRAQ